MTTDEKKIEEQKQEPGFSYENLKSLAILCTIIFAIRWSVASPYHVPTSSMEPTIKVGDRLLAWKLAFDLKIPFTDISIKKSVRLSVEILLFFATRKTQILIT